MPETRSQPGTEVLCWPGGTVLIPSQATHAVMRPTRKAARSDAAVPIAGEPGVGREPVARAHAGAPRRARRWVDVNCAALPDRLVESELFGYGKRAFSRAGAARQGLFELAHSRSLFPDEIGEPEPRVQVKLLLVLQGSPYLPAGRNVRGERSRYQSEWISRVPPRAQRRAKRVVSPRASRGCCGGDPEPGDGRRGESGLPIASDWK
jgi:hypothetical protein